MCVIIGWGIEARWDCSGAGVLLLTEDSCGLCSRVQWGVGHGLARL